MKKSLIIICFTLAVATTVSATTPPNRPKQLTPIHNVGWSDSQAIPPGDITFTWQDNGDAENNPLWFYFYLVKWTGFSWKPHITTYSSDQGVTTITKQLSEGYYAWQVAAVDASASSDPWYAWADRNGDNLINSQDWSFFKVKAPADEGEQSQGPNFYISPLGSDSNPGTSEEPWKTFDFALARLDPGEVLILKSGTYTPVTTGLPNIRCAINAKHGTKAAPITIKAEVERQAFLESDGIVNAFAMRDCAYWNVEGLRGETKDNAAAVGTAVRVFHFSRVSNVNIRKILAARPNRYTNAAAIGLIESANTLLEDSEAYLFHRWGIEVYKGDKITLRRNYTNSRDYPDISGGWETIAPGTGDFGSGGYPAASTKNLLIENGIDENSNTGTNGGINVDGNIFTRILGAIQLNHSGSGFLIHTTQSQYHSFNTYYENIVSIKNGGNGFFNRAGANTQVVNATFYANSGDGARADKFPTNLSTVSTFLKNVLAFDNEGWGFNITGQNSWSVEYSNAVNNSEGDYLNGGIINDTSGNVRFSTSTPPTKMGLGSGRCIVFVPEDSNMARKGKGGFDVGANILYAYENGVLNTEKKLWDTSVDNGRFIGCGAIVPGVNDVAGSSCFDVHKRLNVNTNGCALPY